MKFIKCSDCSLFNEIEQYKGINSTVDIIMAPVLLMIKAFYLFTFNVLLPVTITLLMAKIVVGMFAIFIAMIVGARPDLLMASFFEISKLTYIESIYMQIMQSIFF